MIYIRQKLYFNFIFYGSIIIYIITMSSSSSASFDLCDQAFTDDFSPCSASARRGRNEGKGKTRNPTVNQEITQLKKSQRMKDNKEKRKWKIYHQKRTDRARHSKVISKNGVAEEDGFMDFSSMKKKELDSDGLFETMRWSTSVEDKWRAALSIKYTDPHLYVSLIHQILTDEDASAYERFDMDCWDLSWSWYYGDTYLKYLTDLIDSLEKSAITSKKTFEIGQQIRSIDGKSPFSLVEPGILKIVTSKRNVELAKLKEKQKNLAAEEAKEIAAEAIHDAKRAKIMDKQIKEEKARSKVVLDQLYAALAKISERIQKAEAMGITV